MQAQRFSRALSLATRACPCRAVSPQILASTVLGSNVVKAFKAQSRHLTTSFKAHQFDEAITLEQTEKEGVWNGKTHSDYGNMVGPFGGVIAAQGLQAILKDSRRQGDPITMTLNYLAPMAEGDFQVKTNLKQNNRSTQHWALDIVQGKQTVAHAMLMFGARKETFAHVDVSMPEAPPPDALKPYVFPGLKWLRNYEFRFAVGDLVPASKDKPAQIAKGGSRSVVWVKEHPSRPLDFPGLTALCDVFFPRVFHLKRAMCPAGTVSITINFHASEAELRGLGGDGFLLGEAHANVLHRGYHDQLASLWSRDGRLVATTSQVVYFKC